MVSRVAGCGRWHVQTDWSHAYSYVSEDGASTAAAADTADQKQRRLKIPLASWESHEICCQAQHSRVIGSRRFMSLHVLVSDHWTVQAGHDRGKELVHMVAASVTRTHVLTPPQPIEDPEAWDHQGFCREKGCSIGAAL